MAEGHPFRYNAGEAATTGATSLLHTGVLALAHAAGARGEGLVAFAILLGAALYLASIPLAARIAARLAGPREGRLAGGARRALGARRLGLPLRLRHRALPVPRPAAARSLARVLGRRLARAGVALAGALLALARPEGLPIGARARGREPLAHARRRAASGCGCGCRWRPGSSCWRCSARSRARGSRPRSPRSRCWPNYGPVETLARRDASTASTCCAGCCSGSTRPSRRSASRAARRPSSFRRWRSCWFCWPWSGRAARSLVPARLWLALVALVFALTGPNVFMGVHFNRYLMWAFPGLLAFAAAGLGVADAPRWRATTRRSSADLFRAGGGARAPARPALSTAHFAAVYAELAGETWRREIPMAAFIRDGASAGRRDRQRRDQRRVPHRPPQPQPARRHEPGLRRRPHGRARGGDVRVAGAAARGRAAALPAADALGARGLGADAGARARPAALRDHELRRRPAAVPGELGRARRRRGARARAGALRRRRASSARTGSTSAIPRDEAAHGYRYGSRRGELLRRRLRGDRPVRLPARESGGSPTPGG